MWLLKAAIFFTLLAFALNNLQTVTVYFFFGTLWQAPLVLVVLATFACGLALGVFVKMPRWWKNRKAAHHGPSGSFASDTSTTVSDKTSSLHHGI